MGRKQEIIKTINDMSGRYSGYQIFSDWIQCLALAIQNSCCMIHDKVWQDREQLYVDTMRKYTEEEKEKIAFLTACLIDTLEEGPDDVLGKIYMEAGIGSKIAGQFFTPFHVSELCARMGAEDFIKSFDDKMTKLRDGMTKLTINEPSCGGGAMIIAVAKILKEEGINYQKVMSVVAQDLDWKGVYMCYVQLSLLGISAICVQGDTLADPYVPGKTERSHILRTPKYMGALL